MPIAVPQCTHIKTNGEVCGSPAVSGTELCYHHAKVKSALGKWTPADQAGYGEFTPIPFLFPEDRASLQINYFLLLQAFNEQRVDQKIFRLMLSMLKAMAANLGKSGSLVEPTTEGAPSLTSANRGPREQASVHGVEKRTARVGEEKDRSQPSAASEKISVQASASAEVFAGPIAPESCFSTKPHAEPLLRSAAPTIRRVFSFPFPFSLSPFPFPLFPFPCAPNATLDDAGHEP